MNTNKYTLSLELFILLKADVVASVVRLDSMRAAGMHIVASYSKAACVRSVHTLRNLRLTQSTLA